MSELRLSPDDYWRFANEAAPYSPVRPVSYYDDKPRGWLCNVAGTDVFLDQDVVESRWNECEALLSTLRLLS